MGRVLFRAIPGAALASMMIAAATVPVASAASVQQTRDWAAARKPAVTTRARTGFPTVGFLWTGLGNRFYNAAAGSVTVEFDGFHNAWEYWVTFNGMNQPPNYNAQVTPFGSQANCPQVGDGGGNAPQFFLFYDCFTRTGKVERALFDITLSAADAQPHGTFDYSNGLNQYNSAHKGNSVKHLGTGRYVVTFRGPPSRGVTGTVKVTGLCVLTGWHGTTKGQVIGVNCFNYRGRLANQQFQVVYAQSTNLLGLSGVPTANALVSATGKVETQYDSQPGAKVTAHRRSTGHYRVFLNGSNETGVNGGDVQLTAVSNSYVQCVVDSWGPRINPQVNVTCYDALGRAVNSAFTLQWVVAPD